MFKVKSRRLSLLSVILVMLIMTTPAVAKSNTPPQPNFGPNVLIFDPSMATGDIQASVDAVANQMVDNEMGTQRYALLFKPGTYGSAAEPLNFQVGYYTAVAGLGAPRVTSLLMVRLRPQPLLDPELHRPRELLAIALEPDDKRDHAGLRLLQANSGQCRRLRRCAGSTSLAATRRSWTIAQVPRSPAAASSPIHSTVVINGSQQQWLIRNSSSTAAGRTASGTRCSPASRVRRLSASPLGVRAAVLYHPGYQPADT